MSGRASGKPPTAPVTKGSPLRAYMGFAVGSQSLLALARYEVVMSWGSVLPGALGLLFRKIFWPGLLGSAGQGTVWGRGVVLRHPGSMRIGDGVVVDDECCFSAEDCGDGEFRIGDQALIGRRCVLSAKGGGITIGPRANLGAGCMMFTAGGISIGADTMLAGGCYVGDGAYEVRGRLDIPMNQQPVPGEGVVIEEDCWLGAHVVVVGGVRIGKGSVIAAGAVVTRDVPPYTVAAGVPARAVASRSEPDRDVPQREPGERGRAEVP